MEKKTTLAQERKILLALVRCMLIILSSSKEIYIFVFMILVFRSEISIKMQYVLLQKHVASHRWQFDSQNIGRCPDGHRPVPGRTSSGAGMGIGQFDKRFLNVPCTCQTLLDARPGTIRCPDGRRLNCTI